MGNFVTTIKRFLSNKNTVTILAVLAGIIVLWYFYSYRVEQAITTIRVPYAVNGIDTMKKIEIDNIQYKEITSSTLKDSDMITDVSYLKDKYICIGTSIPKNGFFYESQICEKEELPNDAIAGMPDGYLPYNLPVNNEMTYANSIMPGDYIDLYLQATDDDGDIIFGSLIESIEVQAVRDSSGRDVFWDSSAGDSAYLLFTLPKKYHQLLNVAKLINGHNIKIIPVPKNASYTSNPGDTVVSNEDLYYFIMSKAAAYTE